MKNIKPVLLIDKFKSREDWENYIWSVLIREMVKINSTKGLEKILNILLTAHEKRQMIKRASAISLLKQGKSYKSIGEILWLSPTTISSIRKSLRSQKGYESRYTRHKRAEKKQKPLTKEELEQILFTQWVGALFTLPPSPFPRLRSK